MDLGLIYSGWWPRLGGIRRTLSLQERKDYEKIMDNENGFSWMLVQDRDEVEKYWSVLPTVDPPVVVSIDLEFQIGEPN